METAHQFSFISRWSYLYFYILHSPSLKRNGFKVFVVKLTILLMYEERLTAVLELEAYETYNQLRQKQLYQI